MNFQGKNFFTQNWCNITLRDKTKYKLLLINLCDWFYIEDHLVAFCIKSGNIYSFRVRMKRTTSEERQNASWFLVEHYCTTTRHLD